ncbi:MAG: ribokinase [Bacteroidales bacterium]|nr:ribokinase [Bacteroidales bacterium]
MKNKIVVIGSSNVDLIMKMDHLPQKGETVTDAFFMQTYGGKGANQAVAAARAGGNVAFINCVGQDAYTPQMVQNYKDDGIDTRYVFKMNNVTSGHALVMIGNEGVNYLSVAPGANYLLTNDMIDKAMPIIEEAAVIILQYEIPADTIKYVLDLATEKNIPTVWNFAPARAFDTNYLSKVTTLMLNEVEAGFLAGTATIKTTEEAEKAARILLNLGVKEVIITLGENGAVYFSSNEKHTMPAYKVDVVDTTSAGDVFAGSYAVGIVEGMTIKNAMRFANAASGLCVTKMGAQPSAPMRKEIEAFLKENV